ncbi:hypothetical protein [Sphingomonas montana]|uniref:hypothetical protein n=1 Tax=Sphingomonas montana TaxID=1843236 RepID=UPI00096FA8C6|nr:hypothetical protein [Sphingomonas montana]
MHRLFRVALAASLSCASILASAPAAAQEKSAIRAGFELAAGSKRILLVRPAIKVGAQSTGGSFEPNADWTDQAKANIATALDVAQGNLGNSVFVAPDAVGAPARTLAGYRALFSTVADAVITYQFFPGNRLPTKKRKGAPFEWTLGPGVRDIPGAATADYILFLETEDHFGSTGRKVAQLFAAGLGVGIVSGLHKGYAGLVDARTGDLLWLNADRQMGGDVRDAAGAARRVAQLLEDFPGSTTLTTAPATTATALTPTAAAPGAQ